MLTVVLYLLLSQPLPSQSRFSDVSGTVVMPGVDMSDRSIVVYLESGDQPVAKTYADSMGQFEFYNVSAGQYVIRIREEGFKEATHIVDVPHAFTSIRVMLEKAPPANQPEARTPGPPIVDVRQLAIPKKAASEYEKAMKEIRKNNLPKSIERLKNALKIAPDYYDAHWQLGLQYLKSKQGRLAEAELLRAAELNSRVADPLLALGALYIQEQAPAKAVPVLNRALELKPGSAAATYSLGSAFYGLNELSKAEETLKRAQSLDKDLHGVRLMLVNVYMKQRRYDEALQQLEAFIQEAPNAPQRASAGELRDRLANDRRQ